MFTLPHGDAPPRFGSEPLNKSLEAIMVKNPKRLLTITSGAVLSAYGIKALVTQKISEEGSLWRGAGWELNGEPAIIGGAIMLSLGLYIIYLSFRYE